MSPYFLRYTDYTVCKMEMVNDLHFQGDVDQLVPVLPLLHQYTELLRVLTHNLTQGHRTLCKLTSILLSLFSNLVSKVLTVLFSQALTVTDFIQ